MASLGEAVTLATATARSEQAMDPVKIVAGDGTEIILDRKAALVSGTIKAMLAGAGTYSETEHGEIKFPELSGAVLEKTVRYFYYKLRYTNYTGPGKIPEFKIDPESALELLMAANYLDT